MKDRFEVLHPGSLPEDQSRKDYYESSNLFDSSLEAYEDILNIKVEELRGKKVLDMGGMISGDFPERAKEAGVDLVVLDPQNPYGATGGNNVIGIMQELPFSNDVFDYVISQGSIPYIPNYEEEYATVFSEALRVLKSGGKAVIAPILKHVKDSNILKSIIDNFGQSASVTLEQLPSDEYSINADGTPKEFYRVTIVKN